MKILFLNLPHPQRIVRRYMCTYNSPAVFSPPHELLYLATVAREWNHAQVRVVDALADGMSETALLLLLEEEKPDAVVTLLGVESISTDLACADHLKQAYPQVRFIVFGYYPSTYPEEILAKSAMDAVLCGEPEDPFSACLNVWMNGGSLREIPGLAAREEDGTVFVNPVTRNTDIDALPFPDYSLIDVRKYEEMFMGGPFALVQSSRGCPYTCTFCVTTYGHKLTPRDPQRVVDELEGLAKRGVRVVRFLDDTFTFSKSRVIAICREIVRRGIRLTWGCLARVDTLDLDMLTWMKKAGCARVVVGIESYSPNVLGQLGKNIDPDRTNARLRLIHKSGIQIMGLIMVGAPFETDADFELTVRGLLASPVDHAVIYAVTVYGGTPMFDTYRDKVDFQLIPYQCRWKDEQVAITAKARERTLYRKFYLRPSMLVKRALDFVRFPLLSFRMLALLVKFLVVSRINGDRTDLF